MTTPEVTPLPIKTTPEINHLRIRSLIGQLPFTHCARTKILENRGHFNRDSTPVHFGLTPLDLLLPFSV